MKLSDAPASWTIATEDMAAFEAKHGAVKVKRTTGPSKAKPVKASAADEFGVMLRAHPAFAGVEIVGELEFHPTRGWRFDWAFPAIKLAVEVEGFGRHQTYTGYRGDCEKYNAALLHGWRVLRFVAGERDHMTEWLDTVLRATCGLDDQ